ncbi:ATP-binding protein [Bifidobacterium sp. ESL0682]|uniref:ATP-binding protein n=1 Tax=Bifidobacterium sp. ESL0682 TaxID=2983212 RepID=UPI0023F7DDEC|nr:ATP-binding protein [Bifidobacterium sp. ESL0682]WEV42024.1 ATP-binding protein [Bifidobacterium sp. ESL0682]
MREILDRNEAEHDSIVLQQLLNQQKSQMIRDKETVDLINIKTHDLKKQLSTFGNHLEADEINDLKNLADVYDSSVRTGNETLDVLLAQKSLICEQRGIQFERLIDGKAIDFMKPSDIYALFGNAMDNAMEALNKIDTSSPRFIRMQVKTEKGMAVIHVSNPYNGEITLNNGLPMTTKDDQRYHGFGLRSMQMVAEHYHGALSVETQNNLFVLNIILSKE